MSARRIASCTLPIALAACAHSEPFGNRSTNLDSTLTAGAQRQLTYNVGTDRSPAWSTDGATIFYSYEDVFRTDRDRCLAALPATGGTIRRFACNRSLASQDTTDVFEEPAPAADRHLLLVRSASPPGSINFAQSSLVLATQADATTGTLVRSLPFVSSTGKPHSAIRQIRWLSPTRAVYLGQHLGFPRPCGRCPADTVGIPLEVMLVDRSGAVPTVTPLPNTSDITSLSAGAGADAFFYTVIGDSVVYKRTISTGATDTVYSFSGLGIARDVSVVGTRMLAIVGGRVKDSLDPLWGRFQYDVAGALYDVDLTRGIANVDFVFDMMFRRPALNPSGRSAVAEGYPTIITDCGINCRDTTISKLADLWLFDLP